MTIYEDFAHYIWEHKLYDKNVFHTTNGEKLEIIHPGLHNFNAGPDFFNAKIKIGNTLWAGNVEIHIKASDWFKHNHHTDKAYDNVILHVVIENDSTATTTLNNSIPTWIMPITESIKTNYFDLFQNSLWIPCANKIKQIDSFNYSNWLDRILVEKLEEKHNWMSHLLEKNRNDWEELFYTTLVRSFGFGINGDIYEKLALNTPWTIVQKNRDNILLLEALFLGQGGFLDEIENPDDYTSILIREYQHLKNKYKLNPVAKHEWKFSRLRPSNFPTVRLIQIASLFFKNKISLSKILKTNKVTEVNKLLSISISDYWQTHYYPSRPSVKKSKTIGSFAKHLILINTIIPILFAYGKSQDNYNLCQKAIDWLEDLPPEKNGIINKWSEIYSPPKNAHETQAIVHLKKNYCDLKKCLHCRIGHIVLAKSE